MKFINVTESLKKPLEGDRQQVRKFAWFPKLMGVAGGWVWLEHYLSTQVYTIERRPGPAMKGTCIVRFWKEIDAWFCPNL